MAENVHTVEVKVPAMGSDSERILTDKELGMLRKLLVGEQGDVEGSDYLLAVFSSYMAREVLRRADIDSPEQHAFLGASYALTMKRNAAASEWPEESTPPGFIYDFVEEWLDSKDVQRRHTIGGLSVREYLEGEVDV